MGFTSVVIVGAPRSGTNMLRDALTQFSGWSTWPCDEINYIWRHGNVRFPSDEFSEDMARAGVQGYIGRRFEWVARRYRADVVVEKTCANSLRLGFVDRVIPGARYVFIRRDGLDAVGSAIHRWRAAADPRYLLRKARFVPATDLPYYAVRYIWNRGYRVASRRQRLAFWGPQLTGMGDLLQSHSLEEVCALQWKRCVDRSAEALAAMPRERWVEVGYENLVRAPRTELERIVDTLGLSAADVDLDRASKGISPASVGKGRSQLGASWVDRLEPLIGDTLCRYGYG